MAGEDLLRPLTVDEKKTTYELSGRLANPEVMLRKVIEGKQQEYTKNFEPYDYPCARIEVFDKLDQAQKERLRTGGDPNITVEISKRELDLFGKADRFEFLGEAENKEPHQMNKKIMVTTSYTLKYVCKQRRHHIDVDIPIADYRRKYPKEYKKKFPEEFEEEKRKRK